MHRNAAKSSANLHGNVYFRYRLLYFFALIHSEVRWATNASGAEKKGERLVSIAITFWHGTAVSIRRCNEGETVLS